MTEKYLLFDLEDEKIKKLGEVISNPTCKKIVNILSEKDLSEADLARELNIPINTVEYNLNKLLEAGIIEKAKNFFWSRKGKKIDIYKVANKLIVISPKKSNVYSKLKSIVPVVIVSGILASFIAWYYKTGEAAALAAQKTADLGAENLVEKVSKAAASASSTFPTANIPQIQSINSSLSWEWFLVGSLLTIVIFLIWNWKKL